MGWGTDFTASIRINKKILKTKEDAEEYLKELNEELEDYKSDLMMIAIARPADLINDKEEEDVLFTIKLKVKESLEEIERIVAEQCRVSELIWNFETRELDI